MAETAIERDEIVGLLVDVSDIGWASETLVRLLTRGDDGEEEEADEG